MPVKDDVEPANLQFAFFANATIFYSKERVKYRPREGERGLYLVLRTGHKPR